MSNGLRLVITDGDLPPGVRATIDAQAVGDVILSGSDDARRTLWDSIAGAVVKRVFAVAPKGYRVREIELSLELDGKVGGAGLGGQVALTICRDEDG